MNEKNKSQEKAKSAEPKPYTKQEIAQATRKMFDELSRLRGGRLILGCCTQGCCE